jgi:hypothetical protein
MISDGTGGWYYPRVEVSGDYVHVVWRHISGDGVRYRRSIDGGATWAPIQTLITGYADDPTIAVRDGFVHIVFYMGPSNIKYCRSTDNGASFAAAINLPTGGQGSYGAQVAASGNFVYVAWVPSQDILFMRSADNGASWGAPVNVTSDGATNWEWNVRLAASGTRAYLAWMTTAAPNVSAHFRRGTSNGTDWSSAPITLWTGTIGDFDYIAIAAVGSNVYVDRDHATTGPAQRVSYDWGVTWTGTLMQGGGTQRQPRVDASDSYPDGSNVYIRGTGLYVSVGPTPGTETQIGTLSGSSCVADIAAGTSSDMHVVCNDGTLSSNYEIYYYRYPAAKCGDADASGDVDIDDVVYLIAYIFSGGPPPMPYSSGDADCSGNVDIDDVVYLIAYIFSGGYAPCDTDGDAVPDC